MVSPGSATDDDVYIIGWDAAVDPRNTALSRVRYVGGVGGAPPNLWVEAHVAPRDHEELVDTVSDWAEDGPPTLLCVDSPLGWPEGMAGALSVHVAGSALPISANELFRRNTDIDVRRRVGKTPLDVGADRIARTALATLNAIDSIRGRLSRPIELLTDIRDPRRDPKQILLLESYPAGWFASERITTRGYRPSSGKNQRLLLLNAVERRLEAMGIPMRYAAEREFFFRRADDLDALVCTLSGVDYLLGRCPAPDADLRTMARREGWIWCKDRC